MSKSAKILLAAAGSAALIGSTQAALAQNDAGRRGTVIDVPPGVAVVIVPAEIAPFGSPSTSGVPAEWSNTGFAIPDLSALERQMDRILAEAERSFVDPASIAQRRTFDVSIPALPGRDVSGFFFTSVSNGQGSCARQVTFGGSAKPVVVTRSTGTGCESLGLVPSVGPFQARESQPATVSPRGHDRKATRLIQVDNASSRHQVQVAQLN